MVTDLTWGSLYFLSKSERTTKSAKHAIRIVLNKSNFEHTQELFQSTNVLSFYKLNILSIHIKSCPPVFIGGFSLLLLLL